MAKKNRDKDSPIVLVDSGLRRLSRRMTYILRNVSTIGTSAFRSP